MATGDDLQTQLSIMQKLNKSIERMSSQMSQIEKSYETQVSHLNKINSILNKVNTDPVNNEVGKLNKTLKETSTELDTIGSTSEQSMQMLTDEAAKAETGLSSLAKAVTVGGFAISGLWQGLKNVSAIGKGLSSTLFSVADGIFNIGVSIISIPLKIFTGIVDLAASASAGMGEFRQAIENVRKSFGDLSGPTSSSIANIQRSMAGFSDTGLSLYRVFGNIAERLNKVRELAESMGSTFTFLRKEFEQNGGAILAYQKALGVTDQQMTAFASKAIASNKTLASYMHEVTKQTLGLGKAFGISQKIIGKDMAKAFEDMRHFATLSVKEIGQASVYAQKLGVELDKIVGTLDAFETFDSAAENAAKLTQSFGVTVDAFKLMEAQSPAEQIDLLRKSFREAGLDAANLNRQQLKLLTSTTGLDEATARQVFSLSNQGTSLDDIKNKSEEAEKKQLSQAEAMVKLSSSIEKIVKSLNSQTGSFFDMFTKGIVRGLQSSADFRKTIWNIKLALQQVFYVGVQLGRILPKILPGLGEILKNTKEFFDPATFRALAKGASSAITDFFKGNKSLPEALKGMQSSFKEFFAVQGPIAKNIYDGFKKMFRFGADVVKKSIPLVAEKIKEGLILIVDFIKNPQKALAAASGTASGEFGFFAGIVMEVASTLKGAAKVIWPSFKELLEITFEKVIGWFKSDDAKSLFSKAVPYIGALLFGPMLTRTIVSIFTVSLASAVIKSIKGVFSKTSVLSAATTGVSSVLGATAKSSKVSNATDSLMQVGKVNNMAGEMLSSGKGDKWGVRDAAKLGAKLVALAAALSIGGVMVAVSISLMKKTLEAGGITTVQDAAAPLAVLAAMVIGAVPLAFAMKMISSVGSVSNIVKGGLIISAAVGIVGIVGAGVALLLGKVGSPSQLVAAGKIMVAMTGVFLGMVPLILAATAIGLLATGPQAVILIATAAGMGMITAAVLAVADTAVVIINKLKSLSIPSGFQQRIDAFLSVMDSIQSFTKTIVSILKLSQPTFLELVTGGPTFVEKIDSVKNVISVLIKGKNGDGGILGIINETKSVVTSLGGGGVEVLRGSEIFSNMMSAITSLLTAIKPPDSFYKAGESLVRSNPLGQVVSSSIAYMSKTKDLLLMMTSHATALIKELVSIKLTDKQLKSAQAMGQLFNTVSNMISGFMPPPSIMANFVKTMKKSSGFLSNTKEIKKFDSAAMASFVKTMTMKIKELLPVITGDVLGKVVEIASSIPKEKLESVSKLGTVIASVATLVSSVANISKNVPTSIGNVAEGSIVKVVQNIPSIAAVLDGMKDSLPKLMNSLISIVKSIPSGDDFVKNVKTTEKLFEFLGVLPSLTAKLTEGQSASSPLNTEKLLSSINSTAIFVNDLTNSGESQSPLDMIVASLQNPVFDRLDNASTRAVMVSDSIAKLMKAMSSTAEGTKGIVSSIGEIKSGALVEAVAVVGDMVTKANDLENILNDAALNKIDVPAKLKALASNIGMGTSGRYTIKNKDVNISINLNVELNAADMEKAIIMRHKSIIRDRLNFATNKPNDKLTDDIPKRPGPLTFPAASPGN